MMYEKSGPFPEKVGPVRYQFIQPAQCVVETISGVRTVVGYGIGDIVEVMEPVCQYAIAGHKLLTKIPLSDGTYIVEYPNDMKLKYYWDWKD